MLIDINAYIGHWPFRPLRGNTMESLLDRMDRYGVDKTVVASLHGIFYKDAQAANEELDRLVRSNSALKDRIIPFATINPMLPWWKDSINICKEQMGMKGIRLYPIYHEYETTNERCIDLVKTARDMNMPVSIPLRMIDLRQRSWLDVNSVLDLNHIAALVKEVPDAQYMVLDMRVGRGRATTKKSEEILKNADILFDTVRASGVPITGYNGESLKGMVEIYGKERIAFGTETPFTDYCTPFIRVSVFEEANEDTKNLIWSGNARRMLGL